MQYKHSGVLKGSNSTYFKSILAVYTKAYDPQQALCNYENNCENMLVLFPVRVFMFQFATNVSKSIFWLVIYVN